MDVTSCGILHGPIDDSLDSDPRVPVDRGPHDASHEGEDVQGVRVSHPQGTKSISSLEGLAAY